MPFAHADSRLRSIRAIASSSLRRSFRMPYAQLRPWSFAM